MIKRLIAGAILAACGALLGQLWSLGSLAADPDATPPPDGTANETPAVSSAGHDPISAALARCTDGSASVAVEMAHLDEDTSLAEACLLAAAVTDDRVPALASLRQAAAALRATDPEQADAWLLVAAARGDAQALDALGAAEPGDATDALRRREATLLAADAGVLPARHRVEAERRELQGQALERPEVIAALLAGQGLELPDQIAMRRYLIGLSGSAERSCVWQSAAWDTVAFIRSREQYEAPLKSQAHVRIAGALLSTAGDSAMALGRLAQSLMTDETYVKAASDFMRRIHGAKRALNAQAATAGEAGARDGVRVIDALGGCGSADGLRLARALGDVFSAGALRMPVDAGKEAP